MSICAGWAVQIKLKSDFFVRNCTLLFLHILVYNHSYFLSITAPVAQWIRHRLPTPKIVGSSPSLDKCSLIFSVQTFSKCIIASCLVINKSYF